MRNSLPPLPIPENIMESNVSVKPVSVLMVQLCIPISNNRTVDKLIMKIT